MNNTNYEYGIHYRGENANGGEPHRSGMTLDECREWMAPDEDQSPIDWYKHFKIIRRPVGEWEDYD